MFHLMKSKMLNKNIKKPLLNSSIALKLNIQGTKTLLQDSPLLFHQIGRMPSSGSGSGSIPVSRKISKTKKIEIPNSRVADIVSKSGETIRHLQLQSGAKIQVTRDMDIDPDEQTRLVTLMGTPEEISKAEQLITDLLSKVGLITGKYGRTIRSIQSKLIPLRPLPGDTSTERTVYIDGTTEQIEAAKQLINEVVSEVTQPEQTQLEH
ncbi:hypothetical protein MKW98_017313 [Papaver atlanticum]|uniref:K Homology domain-containing protein n=1 Tax=Papaver atlanticum TaxID=357466 RepID=A0AAD4XJH3_9MAGN|nr:hypothetical protein MKW98_017313 [Papaver atlanticum]